MNLKIIIVFSDNNQSQCQIFFSLYCYYLLLSLNNENVLAFQFTINNIIKHFFVWYIIVTNLYLKRKNFSFYIVWILLKVVNLLQINFYFLFKFHADSVYISSKSDIYIIISFFCLLLKYIYCTIMANEKYVQLI